MVRWVLSIALTVSVKSVGYCILIYSRAKTGGDVSPSLNPITAHANVDYSDFCFLLSPPSIAFQALPTLMRPCESTLRVARSTWNLDSLQHMHGMQTAHAS